MATGRRPFLMITSAPARTCAKSVPTLVVAASSSEIVQELWTADRDFGRFPTLKARNPLVR